MNIRTIFRMSGPVLCLAWLLLLVWSDAALAHRVNIFAWLEGGNVRVECSFRRDSPVRNGTIVVFDAQTGAELLQGRTAQDGSFAFPVPEAARQGHGLRIRILAGEGHQNEWLMDAVEFSSLRPAGEGTAASSAPAAAVAEAVAPAPAADAVPAVTAGVPATAPALSRADVEHIVDAALERHLAPLRRDLAAGSEAGPGLRDIVGGLGWIMGLVGAGLYFSRRRS